MSERGVTDVLLIEDDPGYALMVRKSFALVSKSSRLHVVTDGREALRFLRRAGEHAGAPAPGRFSWTSTCQDCTGWMCWPRSKLTEA